MIEIESMGDWERTHFSRDITPDMDGKEVIAMGWARSIRKLGKLIFVELADREGSVQVTVKKENANDNIMKKVEALGREYIVAVKGTVKKNDSAPGGRELLPVDMKILNTSETPLPMEIVTKKTPAELPTRLDARFIDLRRPEIAAIFKIKSEVVTAFRNYFDNLGFVEIHTPKLLSVPSESGANVFTVMYFNKEAYLAQSPQFYKQMMMAAGFDRVYEIAPVFRAEKHHTYRHVTEFTSMDIEISFIKSYEDLLKLVEKLFVEIFAHVSKNCRPELEILGKKIEVPSLPFPRVTMAQAHDMLEKEGHKVNRDEDLDSDQEKIFSELCAKKFGHEFVFLTEFPWGVRPFYHMKSGPKTTCSSDLLFRGLEMATIPQREHRYEILIKQLKEKGLREETVKFYLDSFRYGMPPHGGAGFGLDRIVMKMLDLPTVKEAILFPRDPERLEP